MDTKIIKLSPTDELKYQELEEAAKIIKRGGLVVFPTETVYGLGADATSAEAAEKIYKAKGRPSDNPLIIHIAAPEDAEKYTYTNELYYRLSKEFMPGPLTVILKAKDIIPKTTRAGLPTVAVRCPENKIARRLIELSGVPIAAPSANLSGSPSPTSASHAIDDMLGRVDAIIDGGESEFGLESTIVKIEDSGTLTLLRPGKITKEELEKIAPTAIADAVTDKLKEGETVLSPGMKYRHYAPKAPLELVFGESSKVLEYIKEQKHKNVAVIAYEEELTLFKQGLPRATVYSFGNKDDKPLQAHILFSLLREIDVKKYDYIFAPLPDTDGIGLALYNRMIRASAHKITRL